MATFVIEDRLDQRGGQCHEDEAENLDVVESRVAATVELVDGLYTEKLARPRDYPVPEPGRRQLDAIENQIREQPPEGDLLEERPSHAAHSIATAKDNASRQAAAVSTRRRGDVGDRTASESAPATGPLRVRISSGEPPAS